MKLKFFERVAEARSDVPSLTIRKAGQCNFNRPACNLLGLEAGEAANIAYDEEGQQWILVYFPDGAAHHCTVRLSKGGFRIQHSSAAKAFFKALPKELAGAQAVRVPVGALLDNPDMPQAKCYLLDTGLTARNDAAVIAPSKGKKGGTRG